MKEQKLISLNPSNNYAVLGCVRSSTSDDIKAQVCKARNAFPLWGALSVQERVEMLEPLYNIFAENKVHLTKMIAQEMGMPISLCSHIDVDFGLQYVRGYLDNAIEWLAPEIVFENHTEIHTLFFEPRGVVGVSLPWNYPFSNFIWGVFQNLIVGNTVVFKHSEECPLTAQLIEEIMCSAQLPEGIFNALYGDGASVGDALMKSNIDLIWFTGSTSVGKYLYQIASQKGIPVVLELGGSAPGIIFKDADLPTTIESVYFNRFVNSGQTCDGLKRLIVHKHIFNEVVDCLAELVRSKKIGQATDPTTDIGPLVNEKQLITVKQQVADAVSRGAHVVCGGKLPDGLKGAYYEPTILTNITFDMCVWQEEVFAPVLPVVSFESEKEAINLANDTPYGLGGYIYTRDSDLAMRVSRALKAGNISVNGINYNTPFGPFGGYKSSGLGREHGRAGMRELSHLKVVAIKKLMR